VKSTAALTAKVSNVAGGVFHLFSTSLSDDQELPISGVEIVIDNYGLSGRTDKNGNLTFLLDNVKLLPENLTLTARFEGSEWYLPVTTEGEVIFEPVASLAFVIPLIAPPLVTTVFVYAMHLRKKRRALHQTGIMEALKEGAILEEKRTYGPQKMQPLRIVFPDIKDRFPNIWGAKEKLNIEIVLDKSVLRNIQQRTVEVFIDEERIAATPLSQQGRAELSHVFNEKGEHRIRAILPRTSLDAEIKLRVVEYREEIIRLYKEFLEELTSYGIYAQKEMTAREIESLILETDELNPEALHDVTNCFEKAEYSNRLPIRKDYEIMYLSLKESDRDVE
jgi:hypothetical protein